MHNIYGCDYCFYTGTKESVKEHEESCKNNPKNKTCLTCKNCAIVKNYSGTNYCCKLKQSDDAIEKQLNEDFDFASLFEGCFGKVDNSKKNEITEHCDTWEEGKPKVREIKAV